MSAITITSCNICKAKVEIIDGNYLLNCKHNVCAVCNFSTGAGCKMCYFHPNFVKWTKDRR